MSTFVHVNLSSSSLPVLCRINVGSASEARRRRERAILEELYASTSGANWERKDGWLSGAPVGQWHGITTDGNGFITEIELQENQLSGNCWTYLFYLFGLCWMRWASLALLSSCTRRDSGVFGRDHKLDEALAT